MDYRFALDLGTNSIGWAVFRIRETQDENGIKRWQPCAIIRAGVRIFHDGREDKTDKPLAVTRREKRTQRRRRDRLLKRKNQMLQQLTACGFFPKNVAARQALCNLNPYALRTKGLDEPLTPEEFGRALFHINQRRGFKSNRKTDKADDEGTVMKKAIADMREKLSTQEARTVGEWLYKRQQQGKTVRARLHETVTVGENGRNRRQKSYDLYFDRGMVEDEFEQLWEKQREFNPALYSDANKALLKDILFFQRPLKPVQAGRCTLLPETETRAPLALPIVQQFRIYQELNHLRYTDANHQMKLLSLAERDKLATLLERNGKVSFKKMKKELGWPSTIIFSKEDQNNDSLLGNKTSQILGKTEFFGEKWFVLPLEQQNQIVGQILNEEDETKLVQYLVENYGLAPENAKKIANTGLTPGYGALSTTAIERILPHLQAEVITYDQAVLKAGFDSHSRLEAADSGEVLPKLPYYGIPLKRHVSFGSGNCKEPDEKCYGKINNPTVHIALNQVRQVVNALIKEYGHPSEVVVEVARELSQGKKQKEEYQNRINENRKRNERIREKIAETLSINADNVKRIDIEKVILWEELHNQCCPYTGEKISFTQLFSQEVEIEHILPFSRTLDDSMNNKTVSLRRANRDKANKTPYEAFGNNPNYDYEGILERTRHIHMKKEKRFRFTEEGYEIWKRDYEDFIARALNDTRYLSKLSREYLRTICPDTWVIPGRMTALIRGTFRLNEILDPNGHKNRNDHRHHAIDACVIGITDRALLKKFADANRRSQKRGLERLLDNIDPPWETYKAHVKRAIEQIWVSHKPNHGHQRAMLEDSAYGIIEGTRGYMRKISEKGIREKTTRENLTLIYDSKKQSRHGYYADGSPKPLKGYVGGSNYCMEIYKNESGKWEYEVISTYKAYQIANEPDGLKKLRNPKYSQSGYPLIMRLMINDLVKFKDDDKFKVFRVCKIAANGNITFAEHFEANVDQRYRDKTFKYKNSLPNPLRKLCARQVTVSPHGRLKDPGFRE